MEHLKKLEKETEKFREAAEKAAEKKAALAAEAYDLETKIKTPNVYGVNEDVFSIGSGRPTQQANLEQLRSIEEKRAFPLVYDDEYRAAFIEYLEAIRPDVAAIYTELYADLHEAEAEYKRQKQELYKKCVLAEQRLISFTREYRAKTWGIHDTANQHSRRPSLTQDNIKDPIISDFSPLENIDFNLEQLQKVEQARQNAKDPEYWKAEQERINGVRQAEKARGTRYNSPY